MKKPLAQTLGPPHAAAGDEVATKATSMAAAAKKVREIHEPDASLVLNE